MSHNVRPNASIHGLLTAAIEMLPDWSDPYTERHVRRAVISIAKEVRQEHLELTSRKVLAKDLAYVSREARRLEMMLRKPSVAKALKLACGYVKTSRQAELSIYMSPELLTALRGTPAPRTPTPPSSPIISDEDFYHFYGTMKPPEAVHMLPNLLRATSVAAEAVPEVLGLAQNIGNVTAWNRIVFAPKTLLAAFGTELYRELLQRDEGPNPKNTTFSSFLSLVWECATGERDVIEWTQALRIAQGRARTVPPNLGLAHLNAQFQVIVFIDGMRRAAGIEAKELAPTPYFPRSILRRLAPTPRSKGGITPYRFA